MKITTTAQQIQQVIGSGVTYNNSGGSLPAGTDSIQAAIDAILAGGIGSYLTTVLGGQGTIQALGTLGAASTIDLGNANYFWGTLDQACTISFTGWTTLKDSQITVEVLEDGTGGWSPTFSGVTWIGGTPIQVTTPGTASFYVFFSRDGGTTIYGALLGAGGTGGGGTRPFKYLMQIAQGNIAFTPTSLTAVDATVLPYQTHTLAVGDVVRCFFGGQLATNGTNVIGLDFEVDRPTSANTFVGAPADYGLGAWGNAGNRRAFTVFGYFTATEAGVHGFRPAAILNSGSCIFYNDNAASGVGDTALTFSTEKLGPVTA